MDEIVDNHVVDLCLALAFDQDCCDSWAHTIGANRDGRQDHFLRIRKDSNEVTGLHLLLGCLQSAGVKNGSLVILQIAHVKSDLTAVSFLIGRQLRNRFREVTHGLSGVQLCADLSLGGFLATAVGNIDSSVRGCDFLARESECQLLAV